MSANTRDFSKATRDNEEHPLWRFAPIIDDLLSPQISPFAELLASTDHVALTEAQSKALGPVWRAMERADKDYKQLPDAGREDLPLTVEGLDGFFTDIARFLDVSQTQLPLIAPETRGNTDSGSHFSDAMGKALREKRTKEGGDCRMNCTMINGGRRTLAYLDTWPSNCDTHFGFLSMSGFTPGKEGAKQRMIMLPILTIDREILRQTLHNGGEKILRDFQEMMGIINHDYFHHFTCRGINVYFLQRDTLKQDETALGRLLGSAVTRLPHYPNMKGANAFKAEQGNPLFDDKYYRSGSWKNFSERNSYEFHALYMHSELYKKYLHGSETGDLMKKHLRSFFVGLKNFPEIVREENGAPFNQTMQFYYSRLIHTNLLRIVPYEHALMRECEALIDDLGLPLDFVHNQLGLKHIKVTAGNAELASEATGVAIGRDPEIPPPENLKVSELIRWMSHVDNIGDLADVHAAGNEWQRDSAIPAMREFFSATRRDFTLAKWRGGLDGLVATEAAVKKNKPVQPS